MTRCLYNICLAAFFNLLFYSAFAQVNQPAFDSLQQSLSGKADDSNKVKIYNKIADHFTNLGNQDSARFFSYRAIELSKKVNYPQGEIEANLIIGSTHLMDAIYEKGIASFKQALKIADSIKDKKGVYYANFYLGRLYERAGDYPMALQYQYESLKLAKEINSVFYIIDATSAIGFIYVDQNNLPEAKKNFEECLRLSNISGNNSAVAFSSKSLADIYLKEGNTKKSLPMLLSAVGIFKTNEAQENIAWTFYSLGTCYFKMSEADSLLNKKENLEKSFRYFDSSRILYEQLQDKTSTAECYADIGNCFIQLKRYEEASVALQNSLRLSFESNTKQNLKKTYQLLSSLDSIKGNYKDAYQNYIQYSVYKDFLLDEEAAKKSIREKFQYEIEERTAEAKSLQDKKDAEARFTRNIQYSVIAFFILVAAFLYWNNRQKQKAKSLVEKAYGKLQSTQAQLIQSEKMASLGELTAGIAHEIQNPLNFVNNFSEVNKELLAELKEEAAKGNINEVNALANDVISNSEKINHHGKRADAIVKGMLQHSRSNNSVKEPTDINKLTDEYVRLTYHGLKAKDKTFNAVIKTDFDESIPLLNIVPQEIGRVILNLVNNAFYAVNAKTLTAVATPAAVKYEPTVSVSTKKINHTVEITVKDNGNGISSNIVDKIFQPFFTTKPTGSGTGLGLSLAYDIVKAHGGEIKVETNENKGSDFLISLPIT